MLPPASRCSSKEISKRALHEHFLVGMRPLARVLWWILAAVPALVSARGAKLIAVVRLNRGLPSVRGGALLRRAARGITGSLDSDALPLSAQGGATHVDVLFLARALSAIDTARFTLSSIVGHEEPSDAKPIQELRPLSAVPSAASTSDAWSYPRNKVPAAFNLWV